MTEALLQSADGNEDGMVSSAEWQNFCAQLRAASGNQAPADHDAEAASEP